MRTRLASVVGGAAILALVVTAGCGGGETPAPTNNNGEVPAPEVKEPIKIGALFAVTGPAAWLGKPESDTALMVASQINEAGGVTGKGEGRPIEVIVKDTEGDNAKAVRMIKELIREGVVAIIGPSRSGTSMAVVPIAGEEEVPLVSCAAAESIIKPVAERTWVFKTPQTDADCARRIFEHMKAKGITKVAIINGQTGFGSFGAKQLKALAPEYGMTIVAEQSYAPNAIDMTAQLTNIRNSGAEALVNWSIVAAQSQVAVDMKKLGITIPLYQSHGFGNVKYAQAAGEAGAGTIFPAGRLLIADTLEDDNEQKAVLTKYKADYEAAAGGAVSTFGGHAYDALWLVVEAIKKGGATRTGIRDALETSDFVGTAGHFKMSDQDHCGLDKEAFEMLTVEWKDGKATFVKLAE